MKHNDKCFKENRSRAEELFEMIDSSLACRRDFYSAHLWNNHSSRIYEIINLEKEYIIDWLADDGDGDDYELMFTFKNENMGRMYMSDRTHEWENGSIACDSICVILSKTGNRKLFNIKTAYPYSSNIPMPTSQEFGY